MYNMIFCAVLLLKLVFLYHFIVIPIDLYNIILNSLQCHLLAEIVTQYWLSQVALTYPMLVLVTERLMPERVSGLKLTGPPAELRFIYALRLRRTNIRVCRLHNDMNIFCLLRECIIPKINSKKLNQIL